MAQKPRPAKGKAAAAVSRAKPKQMKRSAQKQPGATLPAVAAQEDAPTGNPNPTSTGAAKPAGTQNPEAPDAIVHVDNVGHVDHLETAMKAMEEGKKEERKQAEVDGKGVRLKGKLAARASKGSAAKTLHLTKMLPGGSGKPKARPLDSLDASPSPHAAVKETGEEGVDDVAGEERGGEGEDEEEDEDDEDELGVRVLRSGAAEPKRDPIYNVDGIHEKLEDFAWSDGADWLETKRRGEEWKG